MMGRYRKKPVVIDAFQLGSSLSAPAWLADAMDAGTVRLYTSGAASIDTMEGTMTASAGDWIIKGVKDELYPCKPDIFSATYVEAGFED
jgi:hypothetical protein